MIRHISGIAEVVEDVEAAIGFYEALGAKVDRQGDDYAIVDVPGILHFGLWARAHAAESTFGSRDATERVPLGFCLAIEVDDVEAAGQTLGGSVLRGTKDEPWGQTTLRFRSPSGSISEVCESPDSRELATNVTPKEPAQAKA